MAKNRNTAGRGRKTQHNFATIPAAEIPRSTFTRSHGYKTTFDAGYLIPFYVDEILPGDTFNLNVSIFCRLATPMLPLMDNATIDTHFFFVPNRLVWDNWHRFMGEQIDPDASTDFLIPLAESTTGGFNQESVFDYMGIPPNKTNSKCNALPLRGYRLIWNEWFRDQNLQDRTNHPTDDGPDTEGESILLKRGKRHDYFTSALPWPQKGAAVELSLGDTADVVAETTSSNIGIQSHNDAAATFQGNFVTTSNTWPQLTVESTFPSGTGTTSQPRDIEWGTDVGLMADLSTAASITINQMREGFQLQKMLERDARGGTRYTEIVKSHFGVTSPDARLQRPEYLGGGSAPLQINAVPSTRDPGQNGELGVLGGYGTVTSPKNGFTKSFTEHGFVIGLVSAKADLTYQQGIQRFWNRRTRVDHYFPALSHLGEQPILNKEIFMQGDDHMEGPDIEDDLIFGYQERWAEYRFFPSLLTAKLRSDISGLLDRWHLAIDFATIPLLNETFIEEDPPFDRVIQVNTEPHFILDAYFQIKAARPMPVYSVPGLIDHF